MYQPNANILTKYGNLLVNFALNSGKGVKKDEVVMVSIPDVAKPLLGPLQKAILLAGGHPLIRMYPTGIASDFFSLAQDFQLEFFPQKYEKARVELIHHSIHIIAEPDPLELKKIDPRKIILHRNSRNKVMDWLTTKENAGNYTWTLAAFATEGMAAQAGLTLRQYWTQIIKGCYLDSTDPIAEWQGIFKEQERLKVKLDGMEIEQVHVESKSIDLWVKIGRNRAWNGGTGRNIPSFEIFTSPDWRGTHGFIHFNQPLYRYGNLIKGIYLEFKDGKVVAASADQGNKLLQEMLKSKNANKLGEFSLTDHRYSRIEKFMADTLFDENIGGRYGNMHVAIGRAYRDCFKGDPAQISENEWDKMGYNNSPEHTDIITTEDRTVTAYLPNQRIKVIYRDGKFLV